MLTVRTLLTTALAIASAVSLCIAEDEIPCVHNTAPAEADTAHYELQEVWRAGGFAGDVLIGQIADAIGDEQGRSYLLDAQLHQIQIFDADGTHLDTIGREGEGPGEFANPYGLCWWDEGVIAVAAGRIGALDIIDTTGEPVDTLVMVDENGERIMLGFDGCWIMGDAVVLSGNMGTGTENGVRSEQVVSLFGRDGGRLVRLLELIDERPLFPFVFNEATGTAPWSQWAIQDGLLYVATQRNSYEITAYDASGQAKLCFSRDYETRERSEETIETLRNRLLAQVADIFPDATVTFMNSDKDISLIQAAHDGNLWVLNSHGSHVESEDVLHVYDVFDTGGRWLRCAEVRDPHPESWKGLTVLPGNRILRRVLLDENGGVHGDESDAETENGVICYELVRRD